MIYTIKTVAENTQENWVGEANGRQKAAKLAREIAKAAKDHQVFVTWYRSADSQHGYLNPDGNCSPTGKAW